MDAGAGYMASTESNRAYIFDDDLDIQVLEVELPCLHLVCFRQNLTCMINLWLRAQLEDHVPTYTSMPHMRGHRNEYIHFRPNYSLFQRMQLQM